MNKFDTENMGRMNVNTKFKKNINIDNLFPSECNTSGTKGKKLDIETIFLNTALNTEPDISFTSDVLVGRIKKRRENKLNYYKQMLKYCHVRIDSADNNQDSDIVFTVLESIPECKDYDSIECLDYISKKLREDDLNTVILNDTSMFISWKNIESKKEYKKKERTSRTDHHTDSDRHMENTNNVRENAGKKPNIREITISNTMMDY
jgi:hypothetical protein